MPVDLKRTHIRPDDVLAQIPIHLDDDRPGHPGTGHDQVVTLIRPSTQPSSRHTSRSSCQVIRFKTDSRGRPIRRDCDINDEGITQEGICTTIAVFVIAQRDMQWAEVRLLKCTLQRAALDTALEPELEGFINTTLASWALTPCDATPIEGQTAIQRSSASHRTNASSSTFRVIVSFTT
jgi:hypothetical protein